MSCTVENIILTDVAMLTTTTTKCGVQVQYLGMDNLNNFQKLGLGLGYALIWTVNIKST